MSLVNELEMARKRLQDQTKAVRSSESALADANRLGLKSTAMQVMDKLKRQRRLADATAAVVAELESATGALPLGEPPGKGARK